MAVTDEDFVSRLHFADILAEGIAGSSLGAERYEINVRRRSLGHSRQAIPIQWQGTNEKFGSELRELVLLPVE